jgi:hypothetical protein
MNSLQELNNFGSEPFDYIDARPSGVIFDRQYPLTAVDQELFISSTSQMPEPGINIAEIINYQTANVRYRVTIFPGVANPLTGSTIAWTSLPSGVSLTQVGNQYTISGIHSVAEWEAVKYFTWSLPTNYASFPLWYLTVEVIYYDSNLDQEVVMDWLVYDDRFFYVAQFNSSANINAVVGVNSPATANLSASANITAEMFNFVRFTANLTSNANLSALVNVNVTEIFGRATINVLPSINLQSASNMIARASVSCDILASVVNLDPRIYVANTSNNIFATNTPAVQGPTSQSLLTVTLDTTLGKFSSNTGNSAQKTKVTFFGIPSEINSKLSSLVFYPNQNSIASGIVNWKQYSKIQSGTSSQSLFYYDMVYSNNIYIAVGQGISTSSDNGVTWTNRIASTNIFNDIATNGTNSVAVGQNGIIYYSSNGTTWTQATSGTTVILNSVCYQQNAGYWTAVGNSGVILTSSDNGATWTSRTSNTTNSLQKAFADPNLTMVCGNGGTVVTSSDGTTWTRQTTVPTTSQLLDIHRDPVTAVITAVGANGTIVYRTGGGGGTWSSWTSGVTTTLRKIAYSTGSGKPYVVVGDGGVILFRNNFTSGITWVRHTSNTTSNLTNVIWAPDTISEEPIFLVTGANGTIIRTANANNTGTTWALQGMYTNNGFNSIIKVGDNIVAIGEAMVYQSSNNAVDWDPRNINLEFSTFFNMSGVNS